MLYTPKKERMGDNLDYPIVVEDGGEKKIGIARWNDYVRIFSEEYAIWIAAKVLVGLAIASVIADKIALRFLTVQNYVAMSGVSWLSLAQNYLSIFWMRITGTVATPLDFAIVNSPTFEAYRLFETGLYWFLLIWEIRLAFATVGEILTVMEAEDHYNSDVSIMNILTNIFTIGMLWKIPQIAGIGVEVFDAAHPYYIWQTVVWFVFFAAMASVCEYLAKNQEITYSLAHKFANWVTKDSANLLKTIAAIFIVFMLLLTPVWLEWGLVNPYIQGRAQEYKWQPAILPSIVYT